MMNSLLLFLAISAFAHYSNFWKHYHGLFSCKEFNNDNGNSNNILLQCWENWEWTCWGSLKIMNRRCDFESWHEEMEEEGTQVLELKAFLVGFWLVFFVLQGLNGLFVVGCCLLEIVFIYNITITINYYYNYEYCFCFLKFVIICWT